MRISVSFPPAVYKNRGFTDAKQRFYRGETEALSKRNRASNRDETEISPERNRLSPNVCGTAPNGCALLRLILQNNVRIHHPVGTADLSEKQEVAEEVGIAEEEIGHKMNPLVEPAEYFGQIGHYDELVRIRQTVHSRPISRRFIQDFALFEHTDILRKALFIGRQQQATGMKCGVDLRYPVGKMGQLAQKLRTRQAVDRIVPPLMIEVADTGGLLHKRPQEAVRIGCIGHGEARHHSTSFQSIRSLEKTCKKLLPVLGRQVRQKLPVPDPAVFAQIGQQFFHLSVLGGQRSPVTDSLFEDRKSVV